VSQYCELSNELERAVRAHQRVAQDESASTESARQQLRRILGLQAPEKPLSEEEVLRERIVQVEAEADERLKAAQQEIEALRAQLEQERAARPSNVVPLPVGDANSRRPPAAYLREGQREPWRDYVEGGGGGAVCPEMPFVVDPRTGELKRPT